MNTPSKNVMQAAKRAGRPAKAVSAETGAGTLHYAYDHRHVPLPPPPCAGAVCGDAAVALRGDRLARPAIGAAGATRARAGWACHRGRVAHGAGGTRSAACAGP